MVLPAPDRPGAAAEMAKISTKLDSIYSTGKFEYGGKTLTLDDAEALMASSRDPAELKALWEGWHSISPVMRPDYAKLVTLANEGSVSLGFKDTGGNGRAHYDMEPDAFAAEADRLWSLLEPVYRNLHCYLRAIPHDKYDTAAKPPTGPTRAGLGRATRRE